MNIGHQVTLIIVRKVIIRHFLEFPISIALMTIERDEQTASQMVSGSIPRHTPKYFDVMCM